MRKSNKLCRSACLGVLLALGTTQPSFGSVLKSKFLLKADSSRTRQMLFGGINSIDLNRNIEVKIPDLHLTEPATIDITGIQLKLKSKFEPFEINQSNGEVQIKTQSLAASMGVSDIEIHTYYYVGDGSSRMKVALDVSCKDIQLSLPESSKTGLSGKFKLHYNDGAPPLEVIDFSSSWEKDSWIVSNFHCDGPQNIAEQLQNVMVDHLQSIDPYREEIRKAVVKLVSDFSMNDLKFQIPASESNSRITVGLHIEKMLPVDDKTTSILGVVDFHFEDNGERADRENNCNLDFSNESFDDRDSTLKGNWILLPYDAAKALMGCAYQNKLLKFKFMGSQIKAFQDLQNSNFFVLALVWPDLSRWDGRDFKFETEFTDLPLLKAESFDRDSTMSARVKAKLKIDMSIPNNDMYFIPYMHFTPEVSGVLNFDIRNGKIWARMEKRNSSFDLNPSWDKRFVFRNKPNTYVWWGKIEDAMKSAFTTQGFAASLPKLHPFADGGSSIRFTNGEFRNRTVGLGFEFSSR